MEVLIPLATILVLQTRSAMCNMPPSAHETPPQSSVVERSRRKVVGPHLFIPGTQQEAETQLVNHNGTKLTTDEVFVDSLFDSGALNLLVVLGLRLDLSCIVGRNSVQYCTALGPLDRYALAHVIVYGPVCERENIAN